MADILRFITGRDLTAMLKRLPLADRITARRRIEAIAVRWAGELQEKYERPYAVAVCRRRMAYCARHAHGVRWHIWCRIYHYVHPPEMRRDRGKAR